MPEKNHAINLYTIFQLGGWSAFLLINLTFVLVSSGLNFTLVLIYLFTTLVGFFISHLLRLIIKRFGWIKLKIKSIIVRTLGLIIIFSLVWASTTLILNKILFDAEKVSVNLYIGLIFSMTVILTLWCLIYYFYKIFVSFRKSEIEKYKLKVAVKDAQLIALKAQINPHFIFNSLNNIRSLITENPENARDMITNLSGLFRYSLKFTENELIKISDEITVVKNYLELESIQLEDRLHYSLNVEKDAEDALIPPMSLQLLVENSIKHGINKLPFGGIISVNIKIESSELKVNVINTGQIVEGDTSSGIGLKNATERLNLLFGNNTKLFIKNFNEYEVNAGFSIPLKK